MESLEKETILLNGSKTSILYACEKKMYCSAIENIGFSFITDLLKTIYRKSNYVKNCVQHN